MTSCRSGTLGVVVAAIVAITAGCSGEGEAEGAEGGADRSALDLTSPSTSVVPVGAGSTVGVGATTTLVVVTEPPPVCVVSVVAGDSLSAIASRTDLTLDELTSENALSVESTIHPGEVLDICVGNDVDDVTGTSRRAPPPAAVRRQQDALNELFSHYSLLPLEIDGDSGRYTRQAVCAARMGLGFRVHTGHLAAGSDEEAAIFAATELAIPEGAPTEAERWILVDQRCQVIFTGEGDDRVVDVFPTSTGEPGFETHNVRTQAFRFDPAVDNEGWHDSSSFPVEVDNPLNGNMYKPLYFNDGQAIHGAGFIPPMPRSKGCARTFPYHQDEILAWLGLDDETEATWSRAAIGVTVVVQGEYRDPVGES